MNNQTLIDITDLSLSYPRPPKNELFRSSTISVINSVFSQGTPIVTLIGDEDTGKTTVLSQFARRKWPNVCAVFLKPTHFGIEQVRADIAAQIHYYLRRIPLNQSEPVSAGQLRRLFQQLLLLQNSKRETFYFIVDDIFGTAHDTATVNWLLDALPLDLAKNIKFLFSGSDRSKVEIDLSQYDHVTQIAQPFEVSEVEAYFKSYTLTERDVIALHELSGDGHPGKVASIKRLIERKKLQIPELIGDQAEIFPDFLEFEWSQAQLTQMVTNALTVLCYTETNGNIEELARITGSDIGNMTCALKELSFIEISNESGSVCARFANNSLRRFARKKLKSNEKNALRLVLDSVEHDEIAEKKKSKAKLLIQLRDLPALEKYWKSVPVISSIKEEKTILTAISITDEAVTLAWDEESFSAVTQFSTLAAVLRSFLDSSPYIQQLTALLKLGQRERAISLINSSPFDVHRLHLFSVLLKYEKLKNGTVEAPLLAEVKAISKKADFSGADRVLTEVASNLIFVDPEVAIDIVKRAAAKAVETNYFDWLLASIAAKTLTDGVRNSEKLDALQSFAKASDSKLLKPMEPALRMFLGDYQLREFERHIDNLDKTEEKVFLARLFINARRDSEDVAKAAIKCLKAILSASDYVANAQVFRELAESILCCNDEKDLEEIAALLGSQLAAMREIGPTVEYFRVRTLLLHKIAVLSNELLDIEAIKLSDDIEAIEDIATRAGCLAWCYQSIRRWESEGRIPANYGLGISIEKSLFESVGCLLDATAEHEECLEQIIRAMSPVSLDGAVGVAVKANTQFRRDVLLSSALFYRYQSRQNPLLTDTEFNAGLLILNKIHTIYRVSEASEHILDWVFSSKENERRDFIRRRTADISSLIEKILEANVRASFRARLALEIEGASSQSRELAAVKDELARIDEGSVQRDAYFRVSALLAEKHPIEAERVLKEGEETRAPLLDYGSGVLLSLARAAATAYVGLVRNGIARSEDLEQIIDITAAIPADHIRARILGNLVLGLIPEDRALAEQVLDRHLAPLVTAHLETKSDLISRIDVLLAAIPPFWVLRRATAKQYLLKLSGIDRDLVLDDVFEYLLYGYLPREPRRELSIPLPNLTYDSVLTLIELIELVENDSIIYSEIKQLCDARERPSLASYLSRQDKAELNRRLDFIKTSKLPYSNGITHEGYVVLCDSVIYRTEKKKDKDFWRSLADRARSIVNQSDRVYVMSCLMKDMASSQKSLANSLFDEIEEALLALPTYGERLDRMESLIENAFGFDKHRVKKVADRILKPNIEDPADFKKNIRLIDIAYRFDDQWAASLASIVESNANGKRRKEDAKQALKTKQIGGEMISGKVPDFEGDSKALWKACAEAVKSMNGSRSVILPRDLVGRVFKSWHKCSLRDCSDALMFLTTAFKWRTKDAEFAAETLRPIFEGICSAVEVYVSTVGTEYLMADRYQEIGNLDSVDTVEIKEFERAKLLEMLGQWIRNADPKKLIVQDPYFNANEIEFIRLFQEAAPNADITILSALANQNVPASECEVAFERAWRDRYGESPRVNCDIILIGDDKGGDSPLHDRFIYSDEFAIECTSSLNSIGITKDATITLYGPNKAAILRNGSEQYLTGQRKEWRGRRLKYRRFPLT